MVVANVLAGIDYQPYRTQQAFSGIKPVHKGTWYAHQTEVYEACVKVADRLEGEYMEQLRLDAQPLVVCADGAWSHRGYTANHCNWLLLNAADRKIILSVCLMKSRWEKGKEVYKGNYEGSSCGMEGRAMELGITKLKAAGLLPLVRGWVCDKDSSVPKQLNDNPDTAHIPIHWDPGHIKKNFQKQLMKIYGESVRYTNMAARGGKQISQDKDCVAVCIDGIDDGLYDRMRATHRGIFSVLLSRVHCQVTGSWR
jgi:hypothetical protein